MRLKSALILVCILTSALLQGCTLPRGCAPDELLPPEAFAPDNNAVVDTLTPLFQWNYPAGACVPDGFHIEVRDFNHPYETHEATLLGGHDVSWTDTTPLQPGEVYFWSLAATSGGALGPWSTTTGVFYTGPICDAADLVAPVTYFPEDVAYDNPPFFEWDYPGGCLPDHYRIDVSTDPAFPEPYASFENSSPTPERYWIEELEQCTTQYYWRVAAVVDDTVGPFSPTSAFYVNRNAESCPDLPDLPEAIVTIPVTPILTIAPSPVALAFITLQNANCREGPSQAYGSIDAIETGLSLTVLGRNDDATWLFVQASQSRRCWISVVTGQFNGDIDSIPINHDYAELPSVDACSDYQDQAACASDPYSIGGCALGR